ncbi:unnamed protein product [Euphydryas editha]|uniref:ABC transporter domain-containing protein n=1 Tax=Euphydryas editha TaxID=104508 RepID=A0AAU9TVC4_EUPED|nr:unnamed protein product [Euphydryas editha]
MRGVLKVLLWKHFVVRVKKFINSPVEILSTVILFIILLSIKDSLLLKRINYQYKLNIEQSEPILLNSVTGPDSVFYVPETELTRLLMSRIKESLAYNFKENNTNVIKKPKMKPVTDDLALKKISEEIDAKDAIVIFQNLSRTWPKKLKYTIRMKNAYKTYSYRFINNEAHKYFDKIYESFLKLQWAIDSNYLELLTGDKMTPRVTLQALPYIWDTKDHTAKETCFYLKLFCWLSLMLVFVFLSARLLDDRATGIQELIKVMGVSNNVLGVSHVLNVVPAGLVYCVVGTLLVTVTSQPIVSNANPLLIFIMLLLYYLTVIALAFCSSYIVNNSQYGETMAVLMYLLLYIPAQLLETRELARWTLPLCGLLPHVPMHWFWDEMAALQQYGKCHHGGLLPHMPMHWFWDEVAALQQYGNCHHGGLLPHVPMHWFGNELAALQQYGNCHHGGPLPHVPMLWFWDEMVALQQYGNCHHGGPLPHVLMHWFWDEVAALRQYGNCHHGGPLPHVPMLWFWDEVAALRQYGNCHHGGPLPHVLMHWFWDKVAALRQYGMVFSFADIARSHSATSGSVLSCYWCLILQACLYFCFAWYLAKVRPGPHGQALSWNFIFQRQYWGIKKKTPDCHEVLLELEDIPYNTDYFEAAPKDLKVGIKIVNVSKNFAKELALDKVTLNVYKGEITVLLGHNGAGKTTLISIITGILKPTEGKVFVEGLDTVTQKDKMQRIIGLCPQHNLFFPYLTVLEHVMFFTLLKGVGYKDAKTSSQALLEQLGLADKSSYQTSQLSGGMKRRLQLACALAGDAKVLVLDEPTSGLDVQTRRKLWDLLLSLRGSRTVLLSTHFMEEAEALGDRVAALHAGRLRCHATTMHLKRALDTGYRLSFTTIGLPDEPVITAAVTSKIPEATVNETSLNSISYNLQSKNSAKFPELFNFLKNKKSELGIDCIGIGASTLKEVFLM